MWQFDLLYDLKELENYDKVFTWIIYQSRLDKCCCCIFEYIM